MAKTAGIHYPEHSVPWRPASVKPLVVYSFADGTLRKFYDDCPEEKELAATIMELDHDEELDEKYKREHFDYDDDKKRKAYHENPERFSNAPDDHPDMTREPYTVLLAKETHHHSVKDILDLAVLGLKDGIQTVFHYRFAGMSNKDIGITLGVKESAPRMKFDRNESRVKEIIEDAVEMLYPEEKELFEASRLFDSKALAAMWNTSRVLMEEWLDEINDKIYDIIEERTPSPVRPEERE